MSEPVRSRRKAKSPVGVAEGDVAETELSKADDDVVVDGGHDTDGPEDPRDAMEPHDPSPARLGVTDDDGNDLVERGGEESALFPKGALINSGLLDFPPEVVRGVLADAPDEISLTDARELIEGFLKGPVVSTPIEEA